MSKISSYAAEGFRLCSTVPPTTAIRIKMRSVSSEELQEERGTEWAQLMATILARLILQETNGAKKGVVLVVGDGTAIISASF